MTKVCHVILTTKGIFTIMMCVGLGKHIHARVSCDRTPSDLKKIGPYGTEFIWHFGT